MIEDLYNLCALVPCGIKEEKNGKIDNHDE